MKHALIAALAIPVVALAAIACDDSADSESSASQESIDATNARVQRNEMLWANLALQQQPLHDIDDALNDPAAEVPNNAIPTMRTVIRLVAVTEWDDTLDADAQQISSDALALIEALEADDREAAAELATAVHDGQHDFNEEAWEHLAPGAAPEQDHGDEGTPEAGETPSSGATEDHSEDEGTVEAGATEESDGHSEDDATPGAAATP